MGNYKKNIITKKDLQAIRGALRQAFIRSDYKREFLKTIELLEYKTKKSGEIYSRPTRYFICADCGGKFLLKDCKVDHIKPIGQYFDFDFTSGFIERLWCEYSNLQGLCKPCHDTKTKKERGMIKGYNKL